MFRYNPKANYQPNRGRYLQILSGKDLYKQTIVMSTHETHSRVCHWQVVGTIVGWLPYG